MVAFYILQLCDMCDIRFLNNFQKVFVFILPTAFSLLYRTIKSDYNLVSKDQTSHQKLWHTLLVKNLSAKFSPLSQHFDNFIRFLLEFCTNISAKSFVTKSYSGQLYSRDFCLIRYSYFQRQDLKHFMSVMFPVPMNSLDRT